MPYVITREHLFLWPVKVRKPDPDQAGEYAEYEFQMQFRAQSRERVREIMGGLTKPDHDVMGQTLREVCVGWDDQVQDERKKPVPFSIETLAEAMSDPWFTSCAWAAYLEAISKDPKKGN